MHNGPEQTAHASGGAQDGIHQKTRRRLAVGARDAHQLEFFGRVIEKISADDRQRFPRVAHTNPTHPRRNRAGPRQPAHNGARAALDGVGDELIAVNFFTVNGNEQ